MQLLTRHLRHLVLITGLAFTMGLSSVAAERTLTTPPDLSIEIRTLVALLEKYHYNREGVTQASYANVIPDYMGDLDGQRLFFLNSDKQDFAKHYPADYIYWNLTTLGKIDPAYEIFDIYQQRVQARVAWILEELKKDIPLTGQDAYTVDRSKADWPADAATADELWRKRLKFELLQEMLNAKTAPTAPVAKNTVAPKPPDEPRTIVSKRYERLLKNLDEIETSDLTELFLTSITRLYDPHSYYLSAASYEDFAIQMRLQLVGIGAVLGLEDDVCVVKELVPGGPADLGKQLKPEDHIVAVAQEDGEPVEVLGMKLRKIVNMIRGKKDARVRLIVESANEPRREIMITRDVVNLDSARAHAAIFDLPAANSKATVPIGVITLPAFYGPDSSTEGKDPATASKDVAELIKRLQAAHVQGIVLDLRNNGGGLLSEAVSLAGLFVGTGPVVEVRDHEGHVTVDSDKDATIAYTGPMAVLVSRFSASASEIVAGALQNYGRAIIVGDSSTHGKGTVQTLQEMASFINRPPGADQTGAVKLTIQKFYLPDGASTQLKGVVSDIVLPSVDDYLPIGESSLPHALAWDEIKSTTFDGHAFDTPTLAALRSANSARMQKLPEFAYLKEGIAWSKTRLDEKAVSLNLVAREKEKDADAAHKKKQDAELKTLEKNAAYAFQEIFLVPPPPPRIKADKPADADPALEGMDDDADTQHYAKMDIPLREALRIVQDSTQLKPAPQWLIAHQPDLRTVSQLVPSVP